MEEPRKSQAEGDHIPLDLCRQLLADEAECLSDEQIDLIRRHAEALAEVLIEIAEGQSQA